MTPFWLKLLTDYTVKGWPGYRVKAKDEGHERGEVRKPRVHKQNPLRPSASYQAQMVPPGTAPPRSTEDPIDMGEFARDMAQQQAPGATQEGHKPLRRNESRRYDPKDPSSKRRRELGDLLPGQEPEKFRRAPDEVGPPPEEEFSAARERHSKPTERHRWYAGPHEWEVREPPEELDPESFCPTRAVRARGRAIRGFTRTYRRGAEEILGGLRS